eukprot:gene4736-9406_t
MQQSAVILCLWLVVIGNAMAYIMVPQRFGSTLTFHKMSSEATNPTVESLKSRLSADMKAAMKAKEKVRLSAIRAIQTAIKQKEVDERVEVGDDAAIEIMSKMIKQRKESIKSYTDAGRMDLVEIEDGEVQFIQEYMPKQATQEEIDAMISDAVGRLEAKSIKDMAKVMADLRPKLAGRADMGEVGAAIKKRLS